MIVNYQKLFRDMNSVEDIRDEIKNHLSNLQLDLRVTGNGRFMDQKCTPDIISAVADVISTNFSESNSTFTIKSVWMTDLAEEIMTESYQKPSLTEKNAENEYDKVFSQPINLFQSANIISLVQKSGRAKSYSVTNKKILNYISINEKKSLEFLCTYLEEVLKQSNILSEFNKFFDLQTEKSFKNLKDLYINFIINNTPIKTSTEASRIFTKILNPLALKNKSKGTAKGRLSNGLILYPDIFYNRVNFRDKEKPKNQTRKEFISNLEVDGKTEIYQVEKAKRQIKKYHIEISSEIHRFISEPASHVHHIFPKFYYPELSDTLENLILLTPSQHYGYAHDQGNTSNINFAYQLVCLISKLDSIERSQANGDGFYSLEEYRKMVNIGLESNVLKLNMSFQDAKYALVQHYFQS